MVVDGIAESPHETWLESEDKVREMISEKLKMDHRKIEVEPTGLGPQDWKTHHRPRSQAVKLLRFKDTVAVLERAKNLRGAYIFLNKDYLEAGARRGKN